MAGSVVNFCIFTLFSQVSYAGDILGLIVMVLFLIVLIFGLVYIVAGIILNVFRRNKKKELQSLGNRLLLEGLRNIIIVAGVFLLTSFALSFYGRA